ncbi:MerR family DNA-binding transcriptional regulator [Nonomuraea basaltis]|uniref:MerR family DNA-binding transcriptional regulator n=1 Tax=Nonomuraea basaltis TaxID=2495887 RepID=UPI003B84AB6A
MRPVDLAREHGLSTQLIRNYEDAGILPAAERTVHGYRTYTPLPRASPQPRTLRSAWPGHRGSAGPPPIHSKQSRVNSA